MIKKYLVISVALLISLFIYVFYRTEKTLVNEFMIYLISSPMYTSIKADIIHLIPLSPILIYSLPEGLWIFCITLTSKCYYIDVYGRRYDCVYIPLVFCISLEIMQLVHITNGRFDWMDIGISMIFWLIARYTFNRNIEKSHLLTRIDLNTLACLTSYCIVYLAHVIK
ncbi:hypothetical protein CLV32_3468 [Pedobacter duraquae]|uniref:Uncharacterized protein n=1 Tax=Pedobacter duraquae TaxID=425511 RepID=A0A4R6IFM1_9SPHI|nr:hypothetical protein CLV32_3468 [Pedobacter duraquae]